MDLDVRGLTREPAERLVDHHARIGQCETLALGTGAQQERAHAGGLTDAQGAHIALDEVHRVVDRHAGGDHAPGRVDVETDVLVGILRLEEQQLRHHQVGGDLVDRTDQEHHALLEQARVDVIGTLAAAALLDHHRHEAEVLRGLHAGERTSVVVDHHLAMSMSSSKETLPVLVLARPSTHSTTSSSSTTACTSCRRRGSA